MQWIRPLFVAATMALAGCAGTQLARPAPPKNHEGHITAARIIWLEPTAFRYSIAKSTGGYGYTPQKPVVDDREKQQAQARIKAVVDIYRTKSSEALQAALAAEGVAAGNATKIYVQPMSATIDANTGAVSMTVWVSVRYADGLAPWTITPVTQNTMDGAYWNVLRKPGIGDAADVDLTKFVESFANTVVREMQQAGWFR